MMFIAPVLVMVALVSLIDAMVCVAGISAFTSGIKLEPTTRDVSSNKKVVARTAKRTKSCIAETPRVSRRTGPRRKCLSRRAE